MIWRSIRDTVLAEARLYFWRDHNQNKVDLIVEHQRKLIPIEIKSSRTWHKDYAKGIQYFQKITPKSAPGLVLYGGTEVLDFPGNQVLPYNNAMTGEADLMT